MELPNLHRQSGAGEVEEGRKENPTLEAPASQVSANTCHFAKDLVSFAHGLLASGLISAGRHPITGREMRSEYRSNWARFGAGCGTAQTCALGHAYVRNTILVGAEIPDAAVTSLEMILDSLIASFFVPTTPTHPLEIDDLSQLSFINDLVSLLTAC